MMSPSACRGFTLLEVLVAFTILVMVLGALIQVFGGGLRAATAGQQHTRAMLIAQSKLATLAAKDVLAEGVQSGQDEIHRWQVTVVPYGNADAALPVQPWAVTVEVSWRGGEGSRSISLSSLVLALQP
jgi:general secretion pathway protein I